MEFNGVYHQAYDNYCYPLNEDELVINIKTGYDVQRVFIILGDPFAAGILGGGEDWEGEKQEIFFKKRLKNQLWLCEPDPEGAGRTKQTVLHFSMDEPMRCACDS